MKQPLGLYIHIPFCQRKCNYCDFLSVPIHADTVENYMNAVLQEIKLHRNLASQYEIRTIYFGGGTPSIVDAKYILNILDEIRNTFIVREDAEITIECNPGTTTDTKFNDYKRGGINRLSIGLQSTDDAMLKMLGRIHTYEQFLAQYEQAREIGFQNISLDLMSALPGQSVAQYEKDVTTVARLNPEHISSYGLILEQGTPFYSNNEIQQMLPSEEDAVTMYERTKQVLQSYGYERYEISNYAKPGYESRHNSSYWTGVSYLGIGIGASSYLRLEDVIRYENPRTFHDYMEAVKTQNQINLQREKTMLSVEDQMEEFMFLGLRRMRGISEREFEKRFHKKLETIDVFDTAIKKHIGYGNLRWYTKNEERYLSLSNQGIMISNQVFVDFLF